MKLSDLLQTLEDLAPTRHAEPWDNVGLLVGDPDQTISKTLLTIDYTPAVAEEARNNSCDCIISYHPPIFEPLKRILVNSLIFDAIRRGMAIYSPHTALDVADGGTNDMLADAIGIGADRQPLRITDAKSAANYKLVVFTPRDAADKVADALFAAGAGRIGNYSSCSFRSPGTGTFFGEEGTNPAVGQPGQLEHADEVRIETILPIKNLQPVIAALKKHHPYEEPAFDLVQLAAPPEGRGQGRIGNLASPTDRSALIGRIKQQLNLSHLLVSGPTTGSISRAACCAGSCGDLLNDAIAQKAEVYLTGELRHHDALRASQMGLTVVATLHSNSERAVLKRLAQRLQKRLANLEFFVSQSDRDPFQIR
ncbi:MAG TPA: Nif3-like dinuclear metal center hexameric protein [Tepidisphaeraceae bacterium]|jgi:dinuclear metal center YbgI/SA1388 family protein|nr:Nif3-like dinuclear metal center hexameric protein [Tepidisphaeraceae bacterium]